MGGVKQQLLWAALDRNGRVLLDDWGFPCVFKTRKQAWQNGYYETLVRVTVEAVKVKRQSNAR